MAAAAEATWKLRLQPVRGGWIELAYATPMLDCSRAATMLDWVPRHAGPQVWRDGVNGMRAGAGTSNPVLCARTARQVAAAVVERGSIGRRIPP
ncbi:hypothetical protein ACFWB0_21030 [Rhodococcus sp. NPDC060086]|uniref:hypothetical protein n=1 Tax=Rhodococcus sp. NPDC060086 TaxID=3347055 RepID=UPI0036472757